MQINADLLISPKHKLRQGEREDAEVPPLLGSLAECLPAGGREEIPWIVQEKGAPSARGACQVVPAHYQAEGVGGMTPSLPFSKCNAAYFPHPLADPGAIEALTAVLTPKSPL